MECQSARWICRRRHKRPAILAPKHFGTWQAEDDAGLLGIHSDEPLAIPQVPGRLVMRYLGVSAYGFLIGTGFILGKGSMLVPFDKVEKYENEVHFYKRFNWARYLDGNSRLKCDIELESPNAAANLVAGRAVEGMKLWSLHERATLKELLP